MRRILVLAASLLVVLLVGSWIASIDSRGSSAVAHMLEQVANARTVVFKSKVEIRNMPQRMQGKTLLLEPDWVREEMAEGANATVLVFNLKERKSLVLQPGKKTAELRTFDPTSAVRPKNMIEQLREIREASAELLGTEEIDGTPTRKFRCDHPTGHYTIWLAADNDLPVKVVMTEAAAGAPEYVTITLSDFEWNTPLDESLFTLDVPAGYSLKPAEPAPSLLDPTDFIETMRLFVRLNNGRFPAEYNSLTPGSILKFIDDPSLPAKDRQAHRRQEIAQAMGRPEMEKWTEEQWSAEQKESAKKFAHASGFLSAITQSHEWHYVGNGIKLGEAEKIVAWWAPKAEGDAKADDSSRPAQVLYGDLHTEIKPVSGLPVSAEAR